MWLDLVFALRSVEVIDTVTLETDVISLGLASHLDSCLLCLDILSISRRALDP